MDLERFRTLHLQRYNRIRVERHDAVTIIRISHNFRQVPGFCWIVPIRYDELCDNLRLELIRLGWRVERFGRGKWIESGINANYGTSIPPPPPTPAQSPRGILIKPSR